MNNYEYVASDPLSHADPTGLAKAEPNDAGAPWWDPFDWWQSAQDWWDQFMDDMGNRSKGKVPIRNPFDENGGYFYAPDPYEAFRQRQKEIEQFGQTIRDLERIGKSIDNLYLQITGIQALFEPRVLTLTTKTGQQYSPIGSNGGPIYVPPGVDIDKNIKEAQNFTNISTLGGMYRFYDQVQGGGFWDYKQLDKRYEDFGNFNYGATGRAVGFTKRTLLREAGRAQQNAGTSKPLWGDPGSRFDPSGGTGSFGDDPRDQKMIKLGMEYYDNNY